MQKHKKKQDETIGKTNWCQGLINFKAKSCYEYNNIQMDNCDIV